MGMPKDIKREDATCLDCFHYAACKSMLEAMGYQVDGAGKQAALRCEDFTSTAAVAPVQPELRKVVALLHDEYEKALRQPFVRDPLAYALYQVWKAADRNPVPHAKSTEKV